MYKITWNQYNQIPAAPRLLSHPANGNLPTQECLFSLSSSTCVYQDFHGRRLDWDVDGIKVCLFDVLHALHVDVQYADEVLGLDGLHGSFTRPVHVPWELGILDELSVVDPGLHRLSRDVMVIWNPGQNNECWLKLRVWWRSKGGRGCCTFAILLSRSRISCRICGLSRPSCQYCLFLNGVI